ASRSNHLVAAAAASQGYHHQGPGPPLGAQFDDPFLTLALLGETYPVTPLARPCSREFYKAAHSSGTRRLSEIIWIVLHDEEAATARSAAAWFQNPRSGGSAHLCVDDNECYRCL